MKIIKEGQIVFHEKYQISDEAKDFITKVIPLSFAYPLSFWLRILAKDWARVPTP